MHSSFLAKHHIDGIVAMLEVSDVDNVCVCLKRSGQFALKRAIIDGSLHNMPSALQGHFRFAEGHTRSVLHTYNLQVQFLPLHWYGD